MEKAESRRFEVVKVDFNFEAVLKVPRADLLAVDYGPALMK